MRYVLYQYVHQPKTHRNAKHTRVGWAVLTPAEFSVQSTSSWGRHTASLIHDRTRLHRVLGVVSIYDVKAVAE